MTRILKTIFSVFLFFLLLILPAIQVYAEQNQRELLNQYVAELQKNPDDTALREKIIKLALELKPAPAIPKEARRPFVKGVTFQKEATSVSDYELAIVAYKEALLLAPWWPEAYYNLALAQEGAGKFDDGIRSLKLYLLTSPGDTEEAENRIYVLEAKQEKAARNTVAKKQQEEVKPDFSGTWDPVKGETCQLYRFAVNGNHIVITEFCENNGRIIEDSYHIFATLTLEGRTFRGGSPSHNYGYRSGSTTSAIDINGSISQDNNEIQMNVFYRCEFLPPAPVHGYCTPKTRNMTLRRVK